MKPTSAEREEAQAVLSRWGQTPQPADVMTMARGLAAGRLAKTGGLSDGELRAAHDALWDSPVRHRCPGLLESLAEALLSRGIVPQPWEHDGQWWLWWPKKGRGPCQHCRQDRALTRYSNTYGRPYRYLCGRCRKQELADDSAELDRITGVVGEPGESPESLLVRRLAALVAQDASLQSMTVQTPSRPSAGSGQVSEPTAEQWGDHVELLMALLCPLEWAGWDVPDTYDSEFDSEEGPLLFGTLRRTWMMIDVEFVPNRELRLHPYEGYDDEMAFSMLEETVVIPLSGDEDRDTQAVNRVTGELGLLDATRLRHDDGNESLTELMNLAYGQWLLDPAKAYRGTDGRALAEELDADEFFPGIFRFVVGFAGYGVLPDLIPDAAALGVVAWCWRNNTAVEDWHLPSDVLMARVNIAATKAVQPHVDPYEGVDWDSVEAALTSPTWRLGNGALVAELFGEGWAEICRTVQEQIRAWKRLDEELLGPEATLRLLTVAGSTSYTHHWWGQGRWTAICQSIINDAVAADVTLPVPYDALGADRLLTELSDPDQVSDDVLDWLIDLPTAGIKGPRGLRMHPATRPVYRTFDA